MSGKRLLTRVLSDLSASIEPQGPSARRVWSVFELVSRAHELVAGLGPLSVEGELLEWKIAGAAGHAYFTLTDGRGNLGMAMWQSALARHRHRPRVGVRVVVWGRLGVFVPQGRMMFYAERIELAGAGERARRLAELKARLAAEGLLDPGRKRPLPAWPRVVGVVTARAGAAFADIVKVAHGRAAVPILLAPARVQGQGAPESLIRALAGIAAQPDVDVVILGRGGGSADDLAAFDDERLARAVAACPVPVVAAVGHETDTCLVDLVADVRAATPSQAAELVVREQLAVVERLAELRGRLARALERVMLGARARMDQATHAVERAGRVLVGRARRRLEGLGGALERRLALELGRRRERWQAARFALHQATPRPALARARARLGLARAALGPAIVDALARARQRAAQSCAALDAMSPLAVLGRGYALVADERSGALVRSAAAVEPGQPLRIALADGAVAARAERIEPGPAAAALSHLTTRGSARAR